MVRISPTTADSSSRSAAGEAHLCLLELPVDLSHALFGLCDSTRMSSPSRSHDRHANLLQRSLETAPRALVVIAIGAVHLPQTFQSCNNTVTSHFCYTAYNFHASSSHSCLDLVVQVYTH